jgi:urease accessory protein
MHVSTKTNINHRFGLSLGLSLGLGLFAALFSTIAMAHPGHELASAQAGFMHPLTGWDHLLVMLAVGLWAGRLGGKARWQLPLTFMLVMAIGAWMGLHGLRMPGMETGIAASVLAIGLLVALHVRMAAYWQIILVAVFAWVHGAAHGAELTQHGGLAVLAGMLLATGLLHAAGLLLASRKMQLALAMQRLLGGLIALAGAYSLIA